MHNRRVPERPLRRRPGAAAPPSQRRLLPSGRFPAFRPVGRWSLRARPPSPVERRPHVAAPELTRARAPERRLRAARAVAGPPPAEWAGGPRAPVAGPVRRLPAVGFRAVSEEPVARPPAARVARDGEALPGSPAGWARALQRRPPRSARLRRRGSLTCRHARPPRVSPFPDSRTLPVPASRLRLDCSRRRSGRGGTARPAAPVLPVAVVRRKRNSSPSVLRSAYRISGTGPPSSSSFSWFPPCQIL